ncbi:hypothetical protein PVAND_000319 [Polypedilum vanderplanki]|uniref:Uncharacterized protein n=1 Tax=Polypedilum vanderplanki TaxID=319348 RepID=A0A9J6BJH2_POLVA|nr:hypothetical protein PVAND_000319 [Polypedilum vanderplanki]
MKYTILLALFICAVNTQEQEDEKPQIEEAALFMPNMYMNQMQRMGYQASRMPAPPQQAIEYYSQMSDEDFPVDYNLACSNSCGCRTYCVVMWWIPCNCMCPPPCPPTTTQATNRFPVTEFPPQQPPRFPPRQPTTQAPRWPQPEPINPPSWNNGWPQQPNWNNDPHNPNNFPTHRPIERTPSTPAPIWNQRPPIWNPNPEPWDPNNPKNHLTHPPLTTTQRPSVWWPQQPQVPQWPQPEPEIPWWQQPQPQPLPEPNVPWWQQPQPQPIQPIQPLPQPIQPLPQPLPDLLPPNWQRPQPEPIVPDFPHWNQPPITDWAPPREDDGPCDNNCSCTPCTIIWICPVQCSSACCASRRFNEIENAEKADAQNEAQRAL